MLQSAVRVLLIAVLYSAVREISVQDDIQKMIYDCK